MYFVVSAGAPESIWSEWIAERKSCLMNGEIGNRRRVCFRRRPLWKWAVSTLGGSGRAPTEVRGGTGVSRRAEMDLKHRCFQSIYCTFRSLTLKKNKKNWAHIKPSWAFEQRELEFKMLHYIKTMLFYFPLSVDLRVLCAALTKKTKHNLYFCVTRPNLHCLP